MTNKFISFFAAAFLVVSVGAQANNFDFATEATQEVMNGLYDEGFLDNMSKDDIDTVEIMASLVISQDLASYGDVETLNLSENTKQEFLGGIFKKIKKGFEKLGKGIKDIAKKIAKGIKKGVKKFGKIIKNGLKDVAAFMKKNGPKIASIARKVLNAAKPFIPAITSAVSSALGVPIPPQLVSAALAMADQGLQLAAGEKGAPSNDLLQAVVGNVAKLVQAG